MTRAGLRFLKGHGTGNDFVVLPDADDSLDLSGGLVRRLCDRRFGLGADGVLRVVRAPAGGPADWFMDYRNADGSVAEMCGNGVRVYARFLVDEGWAAPGRLSLATRGGIRVVDVPALGDITVDMGPPAVGSRRVKAMVDGVAYEGLPVSMGNPHLVCPVDDPATLDLGRSPEVSTADFPDGVNVEFYAPVADDRLVMRVHERGSGETMSCGTGACAVAVAHAHGLGQDSGAYAVDVPGGRLQVRWVDGTVLLGGPAELVADGVWLSSAEFEPSRKHG